MDGNNKGNNKMSKKYRRGKTRVHTQGYSVNVWKGDETLIAQFYGESKLEVERRADTVVEWLNSSEYASLVV